MSYDRNETNDHEAGNKHDRASQRCLAQAPGDVYKLRHFCELRRCDRGAFLIRPKKSRAAVSNDLAGVRNYVAGLPWISESNGMA